MAQFPMTEDRRWALEKVPDYAVAISPQPGRATVACAGQVLADSTRALLVEESKHATVVYFPPDDVRLDLLEPTDHSTYCPFKGHARYWSYAPAGEAGRNLVWSYAETFPEVIGLQGHLAFYADRATLRVTED